ncbi:MAG: HDOD domain-containing protein [bacterium]|nr:HDOD domain-containing protein [bacterium]
MIEKQDILEQIFSGDKQIPTIPALYMKFNEMIEDPYTTNKDIADLIMKDQSMVVKILRLSNSAMYSKRKEIVSLANAITFLGLETLKSLILQISLVRTFKSVELDIPDFSINTFWEHSLGTAYFLPIITKKLNIPFQESYYIGALLHDIGKLMIYQFYPDEFKDIVLKQINDKASDIDAEEEILGVNHCDIGVYFAEKWKFKTEIVEIIRDHHSVNQSMALHVVLVRICNLFAKAAGLCFPWDSHFFNLVGDTTWQLLSNYTKHSVPIEELVVEIMEESDKIKDSVTQLLGDDKP